MTTAAMSCDKCERFIFRGYSGVGWGYEVICIVCLNELMEKVVATADDGRTANAGGA